MTSFSASLSDSDMGAEDLMVICSVTVSGASHISGMLNLTEYATTGQHLGFGLLNLS